jgi:hypothetical protein
MPHSKIGRLFIRRPARLPDGACHLIVLAGLRLFVHDRQRQRILVLSNRRVLRECRRQQYSSDPPTRCSRYCPRPTFPFLSMDAMAAAALSLALKCCDVQLTALSVNLSCPPPDPSDIDDPFDPSDIDDPSDPP